MQVLPVPCLIILLHEIDGLINSMRILQGIKINLSFYFQPNFPEYQDNLQATYSMESSSLESTSNWTVKVISGQFVDFTPQTTHHVLLFNAVQCLYIAVHVSSLALQRVL